MSKITVLSIALASFLSSCNSDPTLPLEQISEESCTPETCAPGMKKTDSHEFKTNDDDELNPEDEIHTIAKYTQDESEGPSEEP